MIGVLLAARQRSVAAATPFLAEQCRQAVESGLMKPGGAGYVLTPEGRARAKRYAPRAPRRRSSRDLRRYRAYLAAETWQSFGDWLRDGHYKSVA